jgi:hypothetical protein
MIGTGGVGGGPVRPKPVVPAKIHKKSPGSVDLLGDDGGDGSNTLGNWETLKPS